MSVSLLLSHQICAKDIVFCDDPRCVMDTVSTSYARSASTMGGQAVEPAEKRRRCNQEGTLSIKKVRYNTEIKFHEIPRENNPRRVWYTPQELFHFRSKGKGLAMQIATNKEHEEHEMSYKKVMKSAFGQALEKSSEIKPDKGLLIWIQHGHSRRGLERWSVPSVGWYRNLRRIKLIRCIVDTQRSQLVENDEVLRQISLDFSAPGARFAVALAAADAHAANVNGPKSLNPPISS